jgi:hydroxyacylglutathione hydrolase
MPQEIKSIRLMMPFHLGHVNCYLIKNNSDYILIDTGCSNKRAELENELEGAGCKPGNLSLIVLTHGDFDHSGNGAYLQKKFGSRIAMHHDDSGIVERGNMFWNRKKGNIIFRMIAPLLFRFGRSERFNPDVYIGDGYDLSEYGFEARVIHIPGHSKGSIGILTVDGELFCGDLVTNVEKPVVNSIMDDPAAASASIEKLKCLKVNIVYPGHGKPFPLETMLKAEQGG